MAARWIVPVLLLICAGPACAQVNQDAKNPAIALPDPVWVPNPVVPPSQVMAQTAVVSPATDKAPVVARLSPRPADCTRNDTCALPTPEAR